ncbi:MAG: phosphoribosyl-ATP diphosphatase [Actinobacteria bacterium]|nr:MAG: phosphoribosyl-ATP diphosphatase [Actinomycetota bacterium]
MTTDPLGTPTPAAQPHIGPVLEEVFAVLASRKQQLPEDSYTAKLLLGPQDKLLKKIGEEASEVIIAARDRDRQQLRYEIGDLVYHLMVVMIREDLTLDDLAVELADRRKK